MPPNTEIDKWVQRETVLEGREGGRTREFLGKKKDRTDRTTYRAAYSKTVRQRDRKKEKERKKKK